MREIVRLVIFLLITSCSSFSNSSSSSPIKKVTEKGRLLTKHLYAYNFDVIWNSMSPQMISAFKTEQNFAKTVLDILNQIGTETSVIKEVVSPSAILQSAYYRKAKFEKTADTILVLNWSFGKKGLITGFTIKEEVQPAESRYLMYKNKNEHYFPIKKNAFIAWGGRKIEENYHISVPNQRFAYDIVVTRDNKLSKGDSRRNSDHYCFGTPVFSTSSGIVIAAKQGVKENKLGKMNRKELMGNYVVISNGDGEYSFFAHLKNNSVKVRKGDTVTENTQLGECGNTGHSSMPHLHYHLQDDPKFEEGEGLPIHFKDIIVNEKVYDKYEPLRNEKVGRVE